jgi:hypothetical protein
VSELAHIATAYSVSEAHIIQSMLRSYGVEAELFDLQTVNTDPGLMFAVGGIRVFVAHSDATVARELVWQGQQEPQKTLPRPYSQNGWLNGVVAIVLAFMGVASPARIEMHKPED